MDIDKELSKIEHLPGTCASSIIEIGDAASEYLMLQYRHREQNKEYYIDAYNRRSTDTPLSTYIEDERGRIHNAYNQYLREVACNSRFNTCILTVMLDITGEVADRTKQLKQLPKTNQSMRESQINMHLDSFGCLGGIVRDFLKRHNIELADIVLEVNSWRLGVYCSTYAVGKIIDLLNGRFERELSEGYISMCLQNWTPSLSFLHINNVHKWPKMRETFKLV